MGGGTTMGRGAGLQEEISYNTPDSHKPDGTIAECTKRLTSRHCHLKIAYAHTGQYLHWSKVRATAQRRW